jgi:hypothetical protein
MKKFLLGLMRIILLIISIPIWFPFILFDCISSIGGDLQFKGRKLLIKLLPTFMKFMGADGE